MSNKGEVIIEKDDVNLIREIESIHEQFSGVGSDFYLMLQQIVEAVRRNDARGHDDDIEQAIIANKNKLVSALNDRFNKLNKSEVLIINDVLIIVSEWANND